jgi:uncharacterized protein (DUF1330 family)
MTAHAIFQMHVDAPEKLTEYRAVAGAALARHGGSVLTASGAPTPIDPGGRLEDAPGMFAVLAFPTPEAAAAWIADPEFAAAHALRNSAGKGQVWLL